jgi:hypothetical protein
MSITTLPIMEKYAALSGLAKEEVRKGFAAAFGKGDRYLEIFINGETQWTIGRLRVFNELVNEQYELQQPLYRNGKSSNLSKATATA